ncbi:MAG: HAD family hydrolase [Myxococcota bacterium]|nr:HAD-IA family hydrolase [Myxococcota bacterium]MBP8970940.1 HAD-IA family hydrolase [Myxococcota bacterium]OQC43102.1 MAG: Phosphoglycolate phosphatase [Deltaproteobacteria bacterium ADurb.Bin058]HHW97480.1 HAD-IA family hydrolase [Oligoflexales bacterium]HQC44028.1 HAD-IA family hydrolase [Myxococcota bacterium]
MHPVLDGKKAIIFDLDGTLVDSFPDIQASINYALRKRGLSELSIEQVMEYVGSGVKVLINGCIPTMSDEEFEAALADFRGYYAQHPVDLSRPYEGVEQALVALSDFALGVLTNKPHGLALEVLKQLNIDHYFKAIFGADSSSALKPDPAAMKQVLDALEAGAEQAVMVGDSWVDAAAAKAAGMQFVLVRTGMWKTVEVNDDMVVLDQIKNLVNI